MSTHTPLDAARRRYVFRNRLGIGGFGEVYRATLHTGSVEMDVAVKLLRAEFSDTEQAALRLRDEARFLSALRHPSIVRVIDLVKLDGRLALVTEYADGEDLRWALSRSGPVPARAVAQIIARVADALYAAATTPAPGASEAMGLVHRDVKPGNIHLGNHGGVTLLDFGIARTDALDRNAATAAYSIVGSGPYTPPETLLREPYTPAGDIWGLGTTAYEALSGRRMFEHSELKYLARLFVKGDPKAHVRERVDALKAPAGLRQLIVDMLAVDAEDRPSGREVMRRADDLVDGLSGVTLRRWALERQWSPPEIDPGDLAGLTVVEDPLEGALAASLPAPTPTPWSAAPREEEPVASPELGDDPEDVDDAPTQDTEGPGTAKPHASFFDDDQTLPLPAPDLDEDDFADQKTIPHAALLGAEDDAPGQLHGFDEDEETIRGAAPVPRPAPSPQAAPPVAPADPSNRGAWIAALALLAAGTLLVLFMAGSGLVASVLPGILEADPVTAPASVGSIDEPDDAVVDAQAAPAVAAPAPAPEEAPDPDPAATNQPVPAPLAAPTTAPKPTPRPRAPAPSPRPKPAPPPPPAPTPAPAPAPAPAAAAPVPAPAAPSPSPDPAPSYSTRPPDMDTGKLIFDSDVPAEITVDGTVRGTTPITVRLPPGRHTFVAMVPDHPETATGGPIDVEIGKSYQLNLKFQPK